MDRANCDWQVIEKGRTYSILECRICSRETAIGPGERVRSEQFNCPFDVDEVLKALGAVPTDSLSKL